MNARPHTSHTSSRLAQHLGGCTWPLLAALAFGLVCTSVLLVSPVAHAQLEGLDLGAMEPDQGEEAERAELEMWRYARLRRFIRARELAEPYLQSHPDSYVALLTLAWVNQFGEGNYPKSRYFASQALARFEAQHGTTPDPLSDPYLWHQRTLQLLGWSSGDLNQHERQLDYIAQHNELYEPKMIAQRAWPLMKLRRFDLARRAATEGVQSDDPSQRSIGLNALCAIEFEAGDEVKSYAACRLAMQDGRDGGQLSAVDLTNFAEASRSVFDLEEAERTLKEATEARSSWYGNPHIELAELYLREARIPEALSSLKQVEAYRAEKPSHVRNADRAEARRAISSLLIVAGRSEAGLEVTRKSMLAPDRRGHTSRDPAQDLIITSLLDRRAHRLRAEELEERESDGVWEAITDYCEAKWLRFEGWLSGRQAAKLLAEEDRAIGVMRIGTAEASVMPPWLVGDAIELMGDGVAEAAVARAREKESESRREIAAPYYAAFETEARWVRGDWTGVEELGNRALQTLPPGEALLRARLHALRGLSAHAADQTLIAQAEFDRAMQADPGVFRRLEVPLPVVVRGATGELRDEVVSLIDASPRFVREDQGLPLELRADAAGGRLCLLASDGSVHACGEATKPAGGSREDLAEALVAALHERAFAPRVDLSQSDANSLDGSGGVSRDPLRELLGE